MGRYLVPIHAAPTSHLRQDAHATVGIGGALHPHSFSQHSKGLRRWPWAETEHENARIMHMSTKRGTCVTDMFGGI